MSDPPSGSFARLGSWRKTPLMSSHDDRPKARNKANGPGWAGTAGGGLMATTRRRLLQGFDGALRIRRELRVPVGGWLRMVSGLWRRCCCPSLSGAPIGLHCYTVAGLWVPIPRHGWPFPKSPMVQWPTLAALAAYPAVHGTGSCAFCSGCPSSRNVCAAATRLLFLIGAPPCGWLAVSRRL